ncbi:hypothetical protein [Maridesulfovibrio bastinii]|uniref:hypothetical protein n=1 Tax=Maridesulfovibrio bastinii TaxID=47157 RepID=UPI000404E7E5|nr:hypothetical protein [Maridesulfovibrio bastinii]
MQYGSRNITAAGLVLALFCPGLGLFYYAGTALGIQIPFHTVDYIITGTAVAGLFSELSSKNEKPWILPFIAILSAALITYLLFAYLSDSIQPLHEILPFLMQIRPAIYFCLAALWLRRFGRAAPSVISFFAAILAILVDGGLLLQISKIIPFTSPGGAAGSSLIATALLCGLCSTLDEHDGNNSVEQLLIISGIFCSLNRNASVIAVMLFILFTKKSIRQKIAVILAFCFFSYASILVQDMTLLNRNDIPTYWIWAAGISIITHFPQTLLTGMPMATPLPLNVPTTLWQVWYDQQQVWTDFGIFLFNIRPFWLNILLSWGAGGIIICIAIFSWIGKKYTSQFCHSLIFSIIIIGSFEPVFNSPAEAFILFTSFFAACRAEIKTQPAFEFS